MNQKQKKRKRKMQRVKRVQQGKWGKPLDIAGPLFTYSIEEACESAEKMATWRQEALEWIAQQNSELENLLRRFNSFDILANLTLSQMAYNPETYKETEHHGLGAIVEYAGLLAIRHPFSPGDTVAITQHTIDTIQTKVRAILVLLNIYYKAEIFPYPTSNQTEKLENQIDEAYSFFRHRTITHELVVRNPGYHHHQEQRLISLFSPHESWLQENLAFTLQDLFVLDKAIQKLSHEKISVEYSATKEFSKSLVHDYKKFLAGDAIDECDIELMQRLQGFSVSRATRILDTAAKSSFVSTLGETCFTFTADELSERSGLASKNVAAALQFFAVEFDSDKSSEFRFSPTHILRSRPFIHHGGRYLYLLPGTWVWAIQPRIEEMLNPASKTSATASQALWKRYERCRSEYLENECLQLLTKTLPSAAVYQNLFYSVEEEGKSKRAELDGLVVYDTTLFLVEAKAGALSDSARRGSKERLARNLKDLLDTAHSQAYRAQKYIETSAKPVFQTQDGEDIVLDISGVQRIFLVTVTLESMDIFNTVVNQLKRTGMFQIGQLPWAVSLDVLRVICEMNEFPTQLVHYLQRRLRLNEFDKIDSHDELDLFGAYLHSGIYFEESEKILEADYVQLGSFTTAFDDYYLFESGQRKTPATKPIQPMPPLLRKIILELEGCPDQSGHSEIVLDLLNGSGEARRQFVANFEMIRSRTRRDRKIHKFTLSTSQLSSGISCFSTTLKDAEKCLDEMAAYVCSRKYRQKVNKWYGLLTIVDHPGYVHGVQILIHEWQFHPRLEELSQDMKPLHHYSR